MQKKPNILFLFADDMRFDTIAALGNKEIITPNIDRLVKNGTAFTNAYIPGGNHVAVCMPSRAMLHSGRSLFHIQKEGQSIPKEHVTLGETFSNNGYRTFGTGKWHNGTESYARSFTDGAEIFFGGMEDHWNVPAAHFDETGKYEGISNVCSVDCYRTNKLRHRQCDHITPGKHSTELFSDAAIDFIKEYDDDKPFFMYVSYMAPHDPRTMPKRFLDMYNINDMKTEDNFMIKHPFDNGEMFARDELLSAIPRDEEEVKRHRLEYYAMITHLDYEIGRIINQLEKSGKIEDTIIVFSADNGLALGRHGLMGKQNLYDHSLHLPLILSGPGIPKNQIRDGFVYIMDIYPTLCELADISIPPTVNAISFEKAINENRPCRDNLYFSYGKCQRGIRDDQFKLIEYFVNGERNTQLFDFINDPSELNNLSDDEDYKDTLESLREKIKEAAIQHNDRESLYGKEFWEELEH